MGRRRYALAAALVAACSSYEEGAAPPNDGGTNPPLLGDGGTTITDASAGQITIGGLTITPAAIRFPRVICGAAQSQSITIQNGDTAASLDVSVGDTAIFSLAEAVGGAIHLELAPHQQTSFTVKATAIAAGTSSADVILKIAGEVEHHLAVTLEAAGGSLAFTPTSYDFGKVRENQLSPTQKIKFQNDGNDPIQVKSASQSANFTLGGVPFTVPAGGSVEQPVQMVAGPKGEPLSEDVSLDVEGLCGPTPKLSLKGQRLDTPVTVAPTAIDFGDASCGADTPPSQTITVSNFTTSARPFTVALSPNSRFKVTTAGGTIPAGSASTPATTSFTVSMVSVGAVPGDFVDNLSMNVDGQALQIPVRARIRGALLTVGAKTLSLPTTAGSVGKVTLTNSGNMDICVQYARSNNTYMSEDFTCAAISGSCNSTDDTDQVNANSATDWSVRYFTGAGSTVITTKPIPCPNGQSAPLCGAAPSITVAK